MDGFKKYFIQPISDIKNLIFGFFDTAPDLMSEETAKKLESEEESRKLIEEIRIKRHRHTHFSVGN